MTDQEYIRAYLNRIDYSGDNTPCLNTLLALQLHHVRHIVFENLDLLGENFIPNLDREFLFEKIVNCHRGGVCYELNTSFYYLLTALGFDAHQVSGSVRPGENMFSHVATLVRLPEGSFLADVGYGDSYMPVLNVCPDSIGLWEGAEYRMHYLEETVFDVQRRRPGEDWERMYTMCLTPRRMSDYFERFRWASAKGNTAFSQRPICVAHGPGRLTALRRGILTVEEGGAVVLQRPISSEAELEDVLRTYFNLA